MDEGTYWARVQRIMQMMDVRTVFITEERLEEALSKLEAHSQGRTRYSEEELNEAKKMKDAVLHPDTGKKIFLPLRLSMLVPCNLILDTLMVTARGHWQNIGAQWLNQTYNSLHYYANRNASNQESVRRVAEAYVGATASSVGAAIGLNSLLDRMPPRNKWAPVARRFVPFCAVAAADFLNLGITRRNEFLEGVKVYDSDGNELGRSRIAGAMGVTRCIFGRIAAAAPILVVPPLIMHRLEQTEFYRRRPWLATPTLMGMIGVSIQVFAPLAFGVFKQTASVNVSHLEPEFHKIHGSDGRQVKHAFFNKGI